MTTSQTCKACGETKALEAFERLHTGGHRGTCIACRQAATAARKRAKREAYEASPEHQALAAQRQRDKAERDAQRQRDKAERDALREAQRAAAAEAKAKLKATREALKGADLETANKVKASVLAELADANAAGQDCEALFDAIAMAEKAATRAAEREAERLERQSRGAAIRAAMLTGRNRRASLGAVKDTPEGMHNIPLIGGGYISIAELSARHAEREAADRACRSCETQAAADEAVWLLSQPTPTVERLHGIKSEWRFRSGPTNTFGVLSLFEGEDEPEEKADAFDDAFGDWAPAWMQSPAQMGALL